MSYLLAIPFLFCTYGFAAAPTLSIELQIREIERRVRVFDFEAGSGLSIDNLHSEALAVKLKILRILTPEPIALATPEQIEQYRVLAKDFNHRVVLSTRFTGHFPRISLLPLRSWKIAHWLLMYKIRQENFAKDDTDANEALHNVSLANIPLAYRLIEKRKAQGQFTVGPDFAPQLLASRQWREKRMYQRCEEIIAETPDSEDED